ncbi:MAG: serine hydrolase [Kordiimonadaceae bacterium]|nr:serine hydrolase [Kordiimonadaceae bacterium]MBO6568839.1 serine hydrolase [Kordiimonadaceae bacterium]MBO6965186.1 serine hydrolase [Kordiimonadaceae bacterium]
MLRKTIAIVFMLTASACSDKPKTPADMDAQLQAVLEGYAGNQDFSGLVAVAKGGELFAWHTEGYADYAQETLHGLDRPFQIASLSKIFTAAAIQRLQRNGQLDLDEPIGRYLPEFTHGDIVITRQLLAHQSGIADYWTLEGARDRAKHPINTSELLTFIGAQPLAFEPGTADAYSNSGYAVLAALIERVSGQPYHTFLEAEVLTPQGLAQTLQHRADLLTTGYVPSHEELGIQPAETFSPSFLIGAGSFQSTASDLLAWCHWFNQDFANPDTPTFLYGWGAREASGRRWVEQTGRLAGFAAHMRAHPDDDLCVLVLSNIESEAVAAIGQDLVDLYWGRAVEAPARRATHLLSETQALEYAGLFQIAPGNQLEIRADGNLLWLKGQNGEFLPLEPTANDVFFFRQLNASITINRNDDDKVDGLLWGGSYFIPKVDAGSDG